MRRAANQRHHYLLFSFKLHSLVLGAVAGPGHRHAPKILAVLRRALAPGVLGTAASNASDVSEAGY